MILALALALKLLEVKVRPQVCQAPCDVRVEVVIPRHPDNRAWVLDIDGPEFHAHGQTLDGDNAPVIQPTVWFKRLSPGEYVVTVTLYRLGANEVARERRTIQVE